MGLKQTFMFFCVEMLYFNMQSYGVKYVLFNLRRPADGFSRHVFLHFFNYCIARFCNRQCRIQNHLMDFYAMSLSQNVPQATAVLATFRKCDLQICS